MPNKQKHRGAHSKDASLFSPKELVKFKEAVSHLAFLLSENYPQKAALKLVGDQFRFHERQRKALLQSTCKYDEVVSRKSNSIGADKVNHQPIMIDGYNLLIITESILSQGAVFKGMDSGYRDIASIHSTYKKVEETLPALQMIGEALSLLNPSSILWVLDQPISNSGRLKMLLLELSEKNNWGWDVILDNNPDKYIATNAQIAISSDSWVIDHAPRWFNMVEYMVNTFSVLGWFIDLSKPKEYVIKN